MTTGQWFSQYFQAPESYADPIRQYELCKARGMSLVTLTDHDSIEGGLKLIGRPDFFLSVESDAVPGERLRHPCSRFRHHAETTRGIAAAKVERLRGVQVPSLRAAGSQPAASLAEPELATDADTLEKCLALFPVFEATNGLSDRRSDLDMAHFFASITPKVLEGLASKHDIVLAHGSPPRLAYTAGSDDHGQRRCGSIFTEAAGNIGPQSSFAAS